jgi:hypothetical protein
MAQVVQPPKDQHLPKHCNMFVGKMGSMLHRTQQVKSRRLGAKINYEEDI